MKRVIRTKAFQEAWRGIAPRLQKIINRKIRLLAENPTYPSLQTHRLRQAKGGNLWEIYISGTQRLIFEYAENNLILWDVGEHTIVERLHTRQFLHSLPRTTVA